MRVIQRLHPGRTMTASVADDLSRDDRDVIRVLVQFACRTDNPVRPAIDGQDCPSYESCNRRNSNANRTATVIDREFTTSRATNTRTPKTSPERTKNLIADCRSTPRTTRNKSLVSPRISGGEIAVSFGPYSAMRMDRRSRYPVPFGSVTQ